MVFKRLMGAFGVGAPSVDTVLSVRSVLPGGVLAGEVRLAGGDFDADIEHVTLGLVAKAEAEHAEGEHEGLAEFHRARVAEPFTLRKGEQRTIPFQIPLPWELPISQVQGRPLPGMALGVRTELAIAKAVDKGDLDMFAVEPLPSQERVLAAFAALGFTVRSADLEMGHIYGAHQDLPFYQEIELHPHGGHAWRVNEVELTFVTSPEGLQIVLEADRRAGGLGGDAIARLQTTHDEALHRDWPTEIDAWLNTLSQYAGHTGHYEHHDHHHGGPGLGTVAAAGAVGLAGGLVAAEVAEEIFESDDEESDGDW
ncbi:sporulation protein [Spongiactinospora sp. 9N601]|uniref:sporulation protein n=1 Tax=Spongiactinospora sp. 9N601 TaxID=3375149 RepID=UPI0037ABF0FC